MTRYECGKCRSFVPEDEAELHSQYHLLWDALENAETDEAWHDAFASYSDWLAENDLVGSDYDCVL